MLQRPIEEQEPQEQQTDWIRRTSQKILAIGAGLVAFLKYTDRIMFSPTPIHEPDRELIDKLVEIMERTAKAPSAGDD
jgi:hypothetical protein